MIITRTPFRISFCGGGSDLPSFYEKHPGCVISTSINKYMYLTAHPFFDLDKIMLKYSKTELVDSIDDISHQIFKEILSDFMLKGIEITSIADIPAGTGLGSSSSFTVGLLHSLYSYQGRFISKEKLASEACVIEIEKLGEPIGKQDQYAAAYGGLNYISFQPNGKVFVEPIIMKADTYDRLENNLLMFYTGDVRSASKILAEQNKNMNDQVKFDNLVQMTELTKEMKKVLEANQLDSFGEILHESWILKQSLASGISNPVINDYYELALKNGAKGGKLLGAGGGGFLLFYCEEGEQAKLREALRDLRELDFKFDYEGSKVVYVEGHK